MLRNYQEIFRFLQDCTTHVAHHKNSIHTLLQLIYQRPESSFSFSRICYLEEVFSLLDIFHSTPLFSHCYHGLHSHFYLRAYLFLARRHIFKFRRNWQRKLDTLAVLLVQIISAPLARRCHKAPAGRQSHIALQLVLCFRLQVARSFSKDQSSIETSHKVIFHWLMNHCCCQCSLATYTCCVLVLQLNWTSQFRDGGAGLHKVGAGKSWENFSSHHTPIYGDIQLVAGCCSRYLPSYQNTLHHYLKWHSCFILVDHYCSHQKQPFSGTKSQYYV